MKSRTARVLSVGAVLATATAVTTYSQFVSSASVAASASSSSTPGSTPGSGSTASSSPGSVPVTVSSTPVAGSATQFSYVAGDAATVILDSAGGTLRVVAFAPHPGWFTVRLEQPSAMELDIRLESASGQVRFSADLVDGVVATALEGGAPGPANTGPDNSSSSSSTPGTGPDNSSSSSSTPGTGPDNSSPNTSSPGNTAPDDDDDDNSGPGGGGNDDSGGDDDDNSGSGGGGDD